MKPILQGLFLALAGLFAWVPVGFCILFRKKIPWWAITPDEPHSPFGLYEPTVAKIYSRFGPRVSDFYWLGIRNTLFGLAYHWKPASLKGIPYYDDLMVSRNIHWWGIHTLVEGWEEWVILVGPLAIIAGRRLSPIFDHVAEERVRPVNMDGRPVFSIRLAGNV